MRRHHSRTAALRTALSRVRVRGARPRGASGHEVQLRCRGHEVHHEAALHGSLVPPRPRADPSRHQVRQPPPHERLCPQAGRLWPRARRGCGRRQARRDDQQRDHTVVPPAGAPAGRPELRLRRGHVVRRLHPRRAPPRAAPLPRQDGGLAAGARLQERRHAFLLELAGDAQPAQPRQGGPLGALRVHPQGHTARAAQRRSHGPPRAPPRAQPGS
mmetsp:Transcript_124/g.413  ORF Transcript_124/g.413 Transcript_124/m.413 type:complete len:215 (+) Transcript_124:198-842(+)